MRNFVVVVMVLALLAWLGSADDAEMQNSVGKPTQRSEPSSAAQSVSVIPLKLRVGFPEKLTQADLLAAEEFSRWFAVMSWADFDEFYSPGLGDARADKFRALAESYPLESTGVPEQLNAVAKALAEGHQALDARDYAGAEAIFSEVGEALSNSISPIEAEMLALEANTGYRIGVDSVKSDGMRGTLASVERWIDGDTVVTSQGTVRLIGIDTPEMSEQCSPAHEALEAAEQLAPEGADVTLYAPWPVTDTDKYGRSLRYVSLADATDVGYSLLLNDLAEARYDSRDGYQWHPYEKAYRGASTPVGRDGLCSWPTDAELVAVSDDEEDDFERDRAFRMTRLQHILDRTHEQLAAVVADARDTHAQEDAWERKSSVSSDGSKSKVGSSGYTGCRKYAPGGKSWKPIPCKGG